MAHRYALTVALASSCLLPACKPDAPTGATPSSTSGHLVALAAPSGARGKLQKGAVRLGIYEITSLTENRDSCDREGSSVLADWPGSFLVTRDSDVMGYIVELHSCKGVDDCKAHLARLRAGESPCERIPIMLSEQDDKGVVLGTTTMGGFRRGQRCEEAELQRSQLSSMGADRIRIEVRTRKGAYAPSGGTCSTRAASEALASAPCGALLVLEATFKESI